MTRNTCWHANATVLSSHRPQRQRECQRHDDECEAANAHENDPESEGTKEREKGVSTHPAACQLTQLTGRDRHITLASEHHQGRQHYEHSIDAPPNAPNERGEVPW